jgi:DNA repair protein RecO (recombination protein O)
MLRATEHGDYDKIITFYTLKRGKASFIAKGAKKSIKRFAGTLELFSALDLVWTHSRGRGLPILQEASLVCPFENIRTSITKTAYASYWCELVCQWMEQWQKQPSVYKLLEYNLSQLNSGGVSDEVLTITFQIRFMAINGLGPSFDHCSICRTPLDGLSHASVTFDLRRGGILCERCTHGEPGRFLLSKGTIKLLRWVLNAPLEKLSIVRFSSQALEQSLVMLEAFVPYHLGKETKSLKFLKQLKTKLPH